MSPHKCTIRLLPILFGGVTQCFFPGGTPRSGEERGRALIDVLPDEALLEVFKCYVDGATRTEEWHTLVHVCQRWRRVVFASPHYLQLRLLCTAKRPVRKKLKIWPPSLPIQIWNLGSLADNLLAALEHPDRVVEVCLQHSPRSLLEKMTGAMRGPFPAMTLDVSGLSFPLPALGGVLSTAADLVQLHLWNVPQSGYVPTPAEMVAHLSALPKLETLVLGIHPRGPAFSLDSHYGRGRRLAPPRGTRAVLPALTRFWFQGANRRPALNSFGVSFCDPLVSDTRQLLHFVNRAEQLGSLDRADFVFQKRSVEVKLYPHIGTLNHEGFTLGIACGAPPDRQLPYLARVCSSSSPPLATLERLNVYEDPRRRRRRGGGGSHVQWQELFHPFTSVRNLYLSEGVAQRVVPALQELVVVENVFPALQNLFLEGLQPSGPLEEAIQQFVAARRLSGRPVIVHRWERWS
ncbi:hypothetical protein BC826DRAFT_1010387 [Russula brevipes]|nr:hypothetical protein BC826DRAFT_1010387 [Russula brevipes]